MAILVGNNNNNILVGGSAADLIRGLGGNDRLFGNGGNDTLVGGTGRDLLAGGAGRDLMFGGAGEDTLVGGLGRDFLSGGTGRDTFRFDDSDAGVATMGRSDVILDLGKGDIIDLLRVDVVRAGISFNTEPVDGGTLSVMLGTAGSANITWKTFGALHTIEVRGVVDPSDPYFSLYDLYWNHIRWYADDNYGGYGTTRTIAACDTVKGTIENVYDEDWWRIDLKADHLYTFNLASADGALPALQDPGMRFFYEYRGGEPIAGSSGDADTPAEFQWAPETSGTYYLQVNTDYAGTVGSYALDVAAVSYIDDDGGAISAGASKTGTIGWGGDADAFAFTVEDGKTYTIDVEGASTGAGTLVDPYARVYTATGYWLATDEDSGVGENARIVFTASEDATYTVLVDNESYADTGTYRVSLTVEDSLLL